MWVSRYTDMHSFWSECPNRKDSHKFAFLLERFECDVFTRVLIFNSNRNCTKMCRSCQMLQYINEAFTSFPKRRPQLVVTIEAFSKLIRVLQHFAKQKQLVRGKMWKHSVVFSFSGSSRSVETLK